MSARAREQEHLIWASVGLLIVQENMTVDLMCFLAGTLPWSGLHDNEVEQRLCS